MTAGSYTTSTAFLEALAGGGGAVGAKLACPERTVVCLVGDGSYLFGVPSSAQWVARRFGAPALTVIYDNRGWAAP